MSWVALMYHEILRPTDGAMPHFGVRADAFAAQLDWLSANGYSVETLEEAAVRKAPRVVGLTFDDGHWSHHQRAFPMLATRSMRATFFVVTEWVGRDGYASWEALQEMRAAGMSIQSHSATHAYLSTVDAGTLRDELRRSKDTLDQRLGQLTSTIALPGGDEPRGRAWAAVSEAGYTLIATSRPGANREREQTEAGVPLIRRLTVRHGQRATLFGKLAAQNRRVLLTAQVRHSTLETLRRVLGRGRYASWRRRVLARIPGATKWLGS